MKKSPCKSEKSHDSTDYIPNDNSKESLNDPLIEDIVETKSKKIINVKNKYNNIKLDRILKMSLQASDTKIRLSKNDISFPVMVSLKETELEKMENQEDINNGDEATVDLFCVIDRSTSMRSKKLNILKQCLKYCLELLKPNDRISLIQFGSESEILLAPKLIGKNRKLIEETIDSIKVQGKTHIAAGLENAFELMTKRKSRNDITGVLLLSDGEDNSYFKNDTSKVTIFQQAWAERLKNEEFTIHCFGYGNKHDSTLMEFISNTYNGNFYYIKDLETVSDVFIDCLGLLQSIVGNQGIVNQKLNANKHFPEIRFKKTYGPAFNGKQETERQLKIPTILKGFSKDFIFEVTVNGVKNPNTLSDEEMKELYNLITANQTIKNIDGDQFTIEEKLNIEIVNEDYDLEPINKNEQVNKNYMRVHAVEVMQEAQDHADDECYAQAIKLLENISNDLDLYQDDEILKGMKENCIKQKDMLQNERLGIYNEYDRKAYATNMNTCYMKEEAAPQFDLNTYQNNTRSIMSSRVK